MIFSIAISLIIFYVIGKLIAIILHRDCKSKVCLVGKTALVTGGNAGIGYQIVLALVQRGCRVIIVGRKQDPNLLENIYKETQSKNVSFKYADLSSFNSVRALAKALLRDEEKLDILVHNAGLGSTISVATEDSLDTTMQVNYFSAFLLTHLLVDLVKKAEGRIIFTSSETCFIHNFTLEKLKTVGMSHDRTYPNSKVCIIIAADLFAEKLKKYNVTCNTYHPGIVGTSIFKKCKYDSTINIATLLIHVLDYISLLFGKTPEEGAQTAIYLACANEVRRVTGEFFFETKTSWKPKLCHDKKQCDLIWAATEDIVKLSETEKL